ncbi:MAG: hypothetical protein Q7T44_12960 [Parvibaculum sp.]|nr:hypothetical protein [Parvibaculum sp.]
MQSTYGNGVHLTLTDDDLKALGLVVAQWSLAEVLMQNILEQFYLLPAVAASDLPSQNTREFRRKHEVWKKAVRLFCDEGSEMLEIGIFLAVHGKELKNLRDRATHWPASRATSMPEGFVYFSGPRTADQKNVTQAFTPASLLELGQDIGKWSAALAQYVVILSFDMFGPLLAQISGQRPDWMLELLRSYRREVQGNKKSAE